MTVSLTGYIASQASATGSSASSSSSSSSGSNSSTSSGQTSLNTSYQTFLTLLTTQLKNQDPTSPLDPNQFTTELVEMTGVQQQLETNSLLQTLVNDTPSAGVSSAVNLIGKTVTATTATTKLANGSASWNYSLPQTAANATMTISNAIGTVVWSGTAPSFASGSNSFTWNGQNSAGQQLPNGGSYTLSVAASDVNGVAMTPGVSVSGTATAVSSANGVTSVTVNGAPVPVANITNVSGS